MNSVAEAEWEVIALMYRRAFKAALKQARASMEADAKPSATVFERHSLGMAVAVDITYHGREEACDLLPSQT